MENKIPKDMQGGEYSNNESNKFIPSNLAGFYMPFPGQNNPADQYGYDIDIENNTNTQEENKYTRDGSSGKNLVVIQGSPGSFEDNFHSIKGSKRQRSYDEESEEDEVALPVEEKKSFSRSPVRIHKSPGMRNNDSYIQRSIGRTNPISKGIVPVAKEYPNLYVRNI